ncbi:MAG: metallophosphoesterase family protein [Paracoccaceae bacterium]
MKPLPTIHLPPPPERIAVIADVHGNADALRAVLADIATRDVGLIVNLGDHLSGPLAASETANILMMTPAMVCIRGNHDRALLETPCAAMGASDAHADAQIDDTVRRWLATQPVTAWLRANVFLCHATAFRDDDYLMLEAAPGRARRRDDSGVAERLAGIEAALILCGHTHVPEVRALPDGRLVVNPGSVGCPAYADDTPVRHVVETGSPAARYAVLEREAGGWHCDLLQVDYDPSDMAELARAANRTDWAHALMTGRVDT